MRKPKNQPFTGVKKPKAKAKANVGATKSARKTTTEQNKRRLEYRIKELTDTCQMFVAMMEGIDNGLKFVKEEKEKRAGSADPEKCRQEDENYERLVEMRNALKVEHDARVEVYNHFMEAVTPLLNAGDTSDGDGGTN